MKRFDRIFLSLIIAPILPIFLLLASWWTSLLVFQDSRVLILAVIGLFTGILIDLFFLPTWVKNAYHTHQGAWLLVYLFYSICFFGFFMGVPVFNAVLSIPLATFIVRQGKFLKFSKKKIRERITNVSLINACAMAVICTASAFIALSDPFTPGNLKGMLRLPFVVTNEMILALIGFGGIALILFSYVLTRITANIAYERT